MSIQTRPLPWKANPVSRHWVSSGTRHTTVYWVHGVVPRMGLPPAILSWATSLKNGPLGRRLGRSRPLTFSVLIQTVMRTVRPRYWSGSRMSWPHHIHDPAGAEPAGV